MEILSNIIPESDICLCNDLTKKFEKKYRGTPSEVHAELLANPNHEKGEYALVIQLNEELFNEDVEEKISPEAMLIDVMIKQECSLKEAMKILQSGDAYSRNELYKASLNIKNLDI